MPSILIVTVKYRDNSKSLSQDFPCADSQPSAAVIKDCEWHVLNRWTEMGGSIRNTRIDTRIRVVNR